jgi:hypothetical protein
MDSDEKLKLDYERVADYFKQLAEIRFKLLAFVPAIGGAAVSTALISKLNGGPLVAVGILGLLVTLGIVMYDQRNSQLYNHALGRAKWLERSLNFEFHDSQGASKEKGGLFAERPGRSRTILGIVVWHDRALGIIYGATIGAWVYLFFRGVLTTGWMVENHVWFVLHPDRLALPSALFSGWLIYSQLMKYETKTGPAFKTEAGPKIASRPA